MKLKLITLTALGALTLGSSVLANDPADAGRDRGDRGGRGRHGSPFDRMTEQLNLTPEQKAKVQPIMDQARPQLEAIHRDAMEKAKAVMEQAKAQIRPLLTPEQQKKLDEAKSERSGKREGRGGRHGHRGQGGEDGQDDPGDQ
jgi:Spy/CpxP family protein refolding chaperone